MRLLGLILLPFAFVVYATSFNDLTILERKHSVLGDADAANYALLLRDFSLGRKMGDEWNAHQRSLGDNAQKHKLHHVVYAAAGAAIYRVAAPLYGQLGLPPERAMYAVNAAIAVVNLVLLYFLIKRHNPRGNPALPFLLFYGVALSTWIFSSVPESWPFSATLVLLFMLLLAGKSLHPAAAGIVLGVIMLNNVFLAALSVLLVLRVMRDTPSFGERARRVVIAGLAAAVTWFGCLALLSRFDTSFRPDNFLGYTIWFKQFTGADLPRTDPYVWKSAATNLFVNSVVSNQPDPAVPQEALETTLRGSRLGLAATGVYLLVMAVAALAFLRSSASAVRRGGTGALLRNDTVDPAVWCVVMLFVTVILFYPSGFLYSTVVVPALTLFLACTIDLHVKWQRLLLYSAILLILINNASQVAQFREALAAMS